MNSSQLPLSGGIAVFFAVIISYFVFDPAALDGIRPVGDAGSIEQVHGIEDVQARLWQDPFVAAAQHQRSKYGESKTKQFQLSGKMEIQPLSHDKATPVELVLKPSEIKDAGQPDEFQPHSLSALLGEIDKKIDKEADEETKGITILAVMVSAGPYAKQAETRKRIRYAVLTGLGASKYYPKDAEHLGYVDDLNTAKALKDYKGLNVGFGEEQMPLIMPYEWYERKLEEKKKEHVLLLWLDEDAFGTKPLTKLDMLVDLLGERIADIKLIGPYGSGTLKKMVEQFNQPISKRGVFPLLSHKVDVYSAAATATDDGITGSKNVGVEMLLNEKVFRQFVRTIATDGELAKLLYEEIQMRVPPKYIEEEDYDVAVVSEWDTAYGRALPNTLNKHFGQLYQFTYMRGIDGGLAPHIQDKALTKNESLAGNDNNYKTEVERPEGRSQKDYLRGLANQIVRTDQKLKADGKRGIRAIGVLGSDVYDKLMVLRVLRERFPKAVFFTTDLDAALLHPDQFHWVRSLVVASAYGLHYNKINKNFSELGIPPFRDSYQTSVFRSTKLALGDDVINMSPGIYEVGRNGAVSFSDASNFDAASWSRYSTAFLLFLCLVLTFWRRWVYGSSNFLPKSKIPRWRSNLYRFLFAVSILLLVWNSLFSSSFDVHAFSFAVSLLWIFGIYLYVYFRIRKIQRSRRILSIKLFFRKMRQHRNMAVIKKPFYALYVVVHGLTMYLLRPFLYGQLAFLGATFILFFLLIVFMGHSEAFSITSGISIWPTEFLRLAGIWLAFFLLWRGWLKMQQGGREVEKKLGVTDAPGNNNKFPMQDIRKIWHDYQQDGRGWIRYKRIWLPAVIWILICFLIFRVQSPNIPARGEVAYWIDIMIGMCAIGAFFILFCFVVDGALHCRQIIQKLIDLDTWWPFMEENNKEKHISDCAQKLIDGIKREWKEIQLIAMRTDDISKTVYYPIYVILLLMAAQSDYFDNWDMPYPLVLIATVNVAITLWAAIMLRRKALEARDVSLGKIRDIESEALGLYGKERKRVLRKVRFYKAEIENVREGAFLPISEQPWLRALTLMTGGGSSLLLLQYLSG